MAWIESHQSLGTHRKLLRLMGILKIRDVEAVGYLHFLWWWSLDNAPDGNLSDLTAREVAVASHWKGDPARFLDALVTSGWVDKTESLLFLHDWVAYAGKLLDRRASNRERQSEFRKRKNNTHITVTSQLRNVATVPNRTIPNHITTPTPSKGLALPDWIKKENWDAFEEMRKKIKRPMTDYARHLIIGKLEKFKVTGQDPDEILNQSIRSGWQDVYEIKGGNNGSGKNSGNRGNLRSLPKSYTDPDDLRRETATNPGGTN